MKQDLILLRNKIGRYYEFLEKNETDKTILDILDNIYGEIDKIILKEN